MKQIFKIFFFFITASVLIINVECKQHCGEGSPDSGCFILFDIVDDNGNSHLQNTYPIDKIMIYNIDNSLNKVQYWKLPEYPYIGIQLFSEAFDKPGFFSYKYGIILNSTDTDTLELSYIVGLEKNCEYPISDLKIFYNNIENTLSGGHCFLKK